MNLFERWCVLNGQKPFGASPETVARFVSDIAPMGIGEVWDAVQEVSRAHYMHGLPDPTLGGPVAAAINDIAKIDSPRSWPKEDQLRFRTLPYDMQLIIGKREADRDKQIRHLQNELAQLKRKHEHGIQVSSDDIDQAAA
jgi:hypothetical protein